MADYIEAQSMGVGKLTDEPLVGVVLFGEGQKPVARLKLNPAAAYEIARNLVYAAHEIENTKAPAPINGWDPADITLADIDLVVLADIVRRGTRAYAALSRPYQETVEGLAAMAPALVAVGNGMVTPTEMGAKVVEAQL